MQKVKFKEDWKEFSRGMFYPASTFEAPVLLELERLNIVDIYPKVDPEPVEIKPETEAIPMSKRASKKIENPGE